jgi:hypothetical protein
MTKILIGYINKFNDVSREFSLQILNDIRNLTRLLFTLK